MTIFPRIESVSPLDLSRKLFSFPVGEFGNAVPSVVKLAPLGSVKHFRVLFCSSSGLHLFWVGFGVVLDLLVCFGLDLFLLFKFQQDSSGPSLLKMSVTIGLKELNLQEFLGIWSGGVIPCLWMYLMH